MSHPDDPYAPWHALCARAAARGYSLSRGSAPGRAWYSLAPLEDRRPERVVRCATPDAVERVITMKPYYEQDGITIYHDKAEAVLPLLPAARYAIVTDPPYGTGGWRRTSSGAGRNPSGSLVVEAWDDGAVDWLALLPATVIASYWPPANTMHLLNAAHAAGYTKHRALYMRKRDPKPMPGGRTRWSVEPIWILSADGFVLHGGDDVIEVSTPRMGRDADATGHPYEKPLEALTWLLSKLPADLTVVDPFLGSGTTAVACKYLGRRCVGVEMDANYCDIAARRLAQSVMQFGEAA